jgi:molybdate transport system ATP-binding protein
MNPHPALSVALSGQLGQFVLDVRFDVPVRGITALFGPSGSGKTTILRCIAGLQKMDGRISVDGTAWQDTDADLFVPPHQRAVGYVFQEASLFPHMSVRENLLFGSRRVGTQLRRKSDGGTDLDGAIQLLGIGHLLQRSPAALSGGERQRVAVGRALLSNPRILLMDEPLSALDAATKNDVLPYLQALPARLSMPILYVSHDVTEVERLADHVVLLDSGHVTESGKMSDVFATYAGRAGRAYNDWSRIDGYVASYDAAFGLTHLKVAGAELIVARDCGAPGTLQSLRIAAGDVSLALTEPLGTTIENVIAARIISVAEHETGEGGVSVCVGLGTNGDGAQLFANVGRKVAAALELAPGMSVFAQIARVDIT